MAMALVAMSVAEVAALENHVLSRNVNEGVIIGRRKSHRAYQIENERPGVSA